MTKICAEDGHPKATLVEHGRTGNKVLFLCHVQGETSAVCPRISPFAREVFGLQYLAYGVVAAVLGVIGWILFWMPKE